MNEIIEQIKKEIELSESMELWSVNEHQIQRAIQITNYIAGLKYCLRLLEPDNPQLILDQIIEELPCLL